jgi:high-affinity iron transporter
VNGALRAESEYQDAYAFFARAQTLVADADLGAAGPVLGDAMRALAAALPGITAPSAPVPAERVESLVDDARDALASIAGSALTSTKTNDLAPLVARLDEASAALAVGDARAASDSMTTFRGSWTQAEGAVKTRSADAYARIEKDLAIATAALNTRPVDEAAAHDAMARMRSDIAPFVASTTYGVFDAALILFREGVEALLIVAALLAFLAKTGNASKRRWIWAGGGAGVLASVAIAIAVTVAFSASTSAGANRELLEGLTGLFAAVMLIYMSWWLHSKASLASWNRYIRDKSGAAIARNSLVGLSLIAFLAVFREGAETALFYVGMASSIALWDLILGLAIASVALVAIGVLVLTFGMRIPIRPFFLWTSVLVYYLAFKFIGTGIHALQVAGVVSASPRSYLPDLGAIGAFPTIETSAVQAALLAIAAGWLVLRRRSSAVEQPAD